MTMWNPFRGDQPHGPIDGLTLTSVARQRAGELGLHLSRIPMTHKINSRPTTESVRCPR